MFICLSACKACKARARSNLVLFLSLSLSDDFRARRRPRRTQMDVDCGLVHDTKKGKGNKTSCGDKLERNFINSNCPL